MSKPVIVMPDAVAVVTSYLRSALASRGSAVPVVSRVPPTRPPSFVRVERVGGLRATPVTDRARLDVQCWAPTEAAAHDLAALARALLDDLPGVRDGVTVYRVSEASSPMWLPDELTSTPRFAFAVEADMRGRAL
ncbi:hypothetical protein OU787_17315 [Kitasatospora sp. YST-16]|uniref:hypothetical protein n=1 Tax=Kitasatospora sp. YST-16 TaxID=2998080 RepID=UPI00228434D8|nr:hypothetical protein [Kitasatospora sp. YST-16]WAL73110.1 hypothetical protein OU787_17315 [Kitasatospora sp. YST-16]WNW39164.1 hypothetical protein RKE32_17280 [Streptomyces sp. Li-HN-5-13]